jgi:hypothetical protein
LVPALSNPQITTTPRLLYLELFSFVLQALSRLMLSTTYSTHLFPNHLLSMSLALTATSFPSLFPRTIQLNSVPLSPKSKPSRQPTSTMSIATLSPTLLALNTQNYLPKLITTSAFGLCALMMRLLPMATAYISLSALPPPALLTACSKTSPTSQPISLTPSPTIATTTSLLLLPQHTLQ